MKKEKFKFQYLLLKTKNQNKGITLVALIVTIVVLLILAGISITALFGDNGLINKAKIAAEETNQTVQNDITAMEEYNQQLQDLIDAMGQGSEEEPPKPPTKSRLEELMETAATDNETVYDKYGNKIRVPAGFKILAHGTQSRY